jgi:acetylserotonin N-methyltransferase
MDSKAAYDPPTTSDRGIWDLWLSQTWHGAIVAADDAGFFAALHNEPADIAELSSRLQSDERATGILLRLLAALRLVEIREGRYQLTAQARQYLLPSSPFYWGPMLRVGVSEWHHATVVAALKRKDSAHTAQPEGTPAPAGTGRSSDSWATGQISPEQARAVAARMHAHSLAPAIACARTYDFTGVRRLLDVGGGSGCFSIAIAKANPGIHCTIMELPAMCDVAQSYIRDAGADDRVDVVAVDMFRQPWPRGYDAIFFSNVWHDWNFRTCAWLAERALAALPPGGRILLHEMLLDDDGAGPAAAAGFSMLMLLATQGQQFTLPELRGLLEGAGFRAITNTPASGYYSVTTACRPQQA